MFHSTSIRILSCTVSVLTLTGILYSANDAAPDHRVAYIRNSELFVANSTSPSRLQLTHDSVPKRSPLWSPSGHEIAYLADPYEGTFTPHLIVVDLSGSIMADIPVVTDGSSRPGERELKPRTVDLLRWVDKDHLATEGSFNPWACDLMVFAIRTGRVSNRSLGRCGSFRLSPDGKHILAEGGIHSGVESGWRDYLTLDSNTLYPEGTSTVRFLSEAGWSADGKQVALAERLVDSGARNLVTISVEGKSRRVPLPSYLQGTLVVQWAGSEVIVYDGTSYLSADSSGVSLHEATGDQLRQLKIREVSDATLKTLQQSLQGTISAEPGVLSGMDLWITKK